MSSPASSAAPRPCSPRAEDEYQGVRCKLIASLGRARIPFALDFSFGDPNRSTVISLESVIDRPAIQLRAYPLALNLAEKIVTAMQRRETSTRDRDFADLRVTSRRHRLSGAELREHCRPGARADGRVHRCVSLPQEGTHAKQRTARPRRQFRSVEIGPGLSHTLQDQLVRMAEMARGDQKRAPLFVMPVLTRKADRGRRASTGSPEPFDRNTVSREWHEIALKDAALRDMPLHSLRHTAAAAWLAGGNSLMYVQRQFGHADIGTTERYYGHLERHVLAAGAIATEEAITRATKRAA
ncbi:MAG: nucleotidyl transferase AbiEii/AbiGii toxin family protein [Solirubrobacteraceae bacterium]